MKWSFDRRRWWRWGVEHFMPFSTFDDCRVFGTATRGEFIIVRVSRLKHTLCQTDSMDSGELVCAVVRLPC